MNSTRQTVFITGVSSGIGHGLANVYLERGDIVYGVSRRAPDDLISSQDFHFAAIDLCDVPLVESELARLLKSVANLDTVVLNAGILGTIADMKDTCLADLRHLMEVNVWSYKTVIDVLTGLDCKINRVITISSGAAVNGNRGWNGYSISKAALNMLTMLYAAEFENIHFAAVAPGLVDTAMQDYLCEHTFDPRFPSLQSIKSKRGTTEMPTPSEAAKKLVSLFDVIEDRLPSGDFIDIRHLPEFSGMRRI